HTRAYIQRLPQRGTPHMAGSTAPAFVQGCLPNATVPLHYSEIKRFPMVNRMQFYIDGAWVDPVVNPATEDALYEVALGSKADLDKAVAAAKRAFLTYSQISREERIALLEKIIEIYKGRMKEIGAAVSDEMGAPLPMAERLQAGAG